MATTPARANGGKATAAKRTPEERKAAALKASQAKSDLSKLPVATHSGDLVIGSAVMRCYVLPDNTRVLTQEGFFTALGRAAKPKAGHGASTIDDGVDKLPGFMAANNLKPFISNELLLSTTPISFKTPDGIKAFGYSANLLPKVCRVYLEARDAGVTLKTQEHLVRAADLLMRAFAEVGIIALVDEATGFQKDRDRDALARILEAFVAKELQPYVKTFPADYYEELFRLRNVPFPPQKPQFRPQYFGLLTNDIVYERIAPGLLAELKKQAAKDEKKAHLHRRLTQEVGHPKLREHLASVVTAMKLSNNYTDFIGKLNRLHPRYGETVPLDLDEADR